MKDLRAGDDVDGWQIERKIGQGSMGTVYEARRSGERAALKVIRGDITDPEALARFRREARVLLSIQHANVVRCYATGEVDGNGVYLALEYLDGGSLQDVIDKRGRLPVPQAVGAIRAVLGGLAVIHQQGIIHRDVKPGNVLLDSQGRAKLADFGLARPDDASTALTQSGTVLGTPYYMAPEQIRGAEIGPPIDIYAAGATLYVLLTGAPPYPHENPLKVLQAHLKDPIPDVRVKLPNAPDKIVHALDALLAKSADDRPASAAAAIALFDGLPSMFIQRSAPGESTITEALPPGASSAPDAPAKGPARMSVAMEALEHARGSDAIMKKGTARVTMGSLTDQAPPPPRKASGRTQALDAQRDSRRTGPGKRPSTSDAAALPEPERAEPAERSRRRRSSDDHQVVDDLPAGPVAPKPLPDPQRSKAWGRLVGLVVVLVALLVGDLMLRARGTDLLNVGLTKLLAWERGIAATGWEATTAPYARRALRGLMDARGWLDANLIGVFAVVGLLLTERLAARALRHGIIDRLALRRRADRLRRKGEVHQAALVWEVLDQRPEGARLLLEHGLPVLAAEMFLAAGMVDEARAARGLPPREALAPASRGVAPAAPDASPPGVGWPDPDGRGAPPGRSTR